MEMHSKITLQKGSDHALAASFPGLYEKGDVEHINVPLQPTRQNHSWFEDHSSVRITLKMAGS